MKRKAVLRLRIVQSLSEPDALSIRDMDGHSGAFKRNLKRAGFKAGDIAEIVLVEDAEVTK